MKNGTKLKNRRNKKITCTNAHGAAAITRHSGYFTGHLGNLSPVTRSSVHLRANKVCFSH